jgi:hypothetical protein
MTDATELMYKDAVGRLARRIEGELLRLEAIYNFDHGAEFEVALCQVLRAALPRKYGVCRGHVVTATKRNGRGRYPCLRSRRIANAQNAGGTRFLQKGVRPSRRPPCLH